MSQVIEELAGVPLERLHEIAKREAQRYVKSRPKTQKALKSGSASYLDGVPMHWMKDWPMPFPMLVQKAKAAQITDLDGHRIDDFCLGDTGSMFGHSPKPVSKAIRKQAKRGLTYMLPTEAALTAGALLTERFGDFAWQIATTATDANRFALRVARAVTGRPRVLVFNGCYHGTVDDAMVELRGGKTATREGLVGQVADLTQTAVCAEFDFVDHRGIVVAICFHFVYKKHMVALGEKTIHPRHPSHTRLGLISYCLFSLMFV